MKFNIPFKEWFCVWNLLHSHIFTVVLSAGHQLSKLPQATAQMLPLPAEHGGIWEQADQGERLVTLESVTDISPFPNSPLTSFPHSPDLILTLSWPHSHILLTSFPHSPDLIPRLSPDLIPTLSRSHSHILLTSFPDSPLTSFPDSLSWDFIPN